MNALSCKALRVLYGTLGLLLVTVIPVISQSITQHKITASYSQATLSSILADLQQSEDIRFFYRQDELPGTIHTAEWQDVALDDVMDELLDGSAIGYTVYRDRDIILMPRTVIDEVYTVNYYKALERSTQLEDLPPQPQVITIGSVRDLSASGRSTIRGTVTDTEDESPIIGATITWTDLNEGTTTDENGQFEMTVPVGLHEVVVRYVGFEDLYRTVDVYSNGSLDLALTSATIDLQEVTVRAQAADASVENVQIGVASLDIKNIKKVPAFLGEADVVKNLLLNPGVSSLGEGATGFNVRGGTVDQNMILQDDGFFFNASHALGFFSSFNADLISSVDLYKGNIPAHYGGRLASAMDVEMRNGSFERFKLKGGLGPVSSRLALEGPIVKDRVSFIAGLRSSYSDWILKQVDVLEVSKSSALFYDANARLTIKPSDKSTLILSGYGSEDEFVYNEEFGFDYSTVMGQFIYKQIFSDNAYNKFSVVGSRYESTQTDFEGLDAAKLVNGISYIKALEHLTLTPGEHLQIDAGLESIYYQVEPGEQEPLGETSDIVLKGVEDEQGLESAIFANLEYRISPALTVAAGLRGVYYQYLGAKTISLYADPERPSVTTITGSETYGSGEQITSYTSFEPRASMRYRFTESTSVKLGYSRTSQFINQIFNTDSPTPTSQWQLSTPYFQPFRSHNVSVGLFKNFEDNLWETSVEVYGRDIDELYDYVDFAELVVNERLETEFLTGVGRSYGAELSIKKKSGIVNGWLAYTLSRSELKIDGINRNQWYPSNFDKTHDLSLILNYQPNRRNTISINFNYSTGRPTTPPIGNYRTDGGLVIPIYAERNQFRVPDYHRLDIAYTLGKGYKRDKKIQTSWTISVYNVYARRNAFSVYFTQAAFQQAQANRLAVLGSAIPSVTFNIEII